MRTRTIAATIITALALTSCSSSSDDASDTKPKVSASAQASAEEPTQDQKDDAAKAAGIPPEPTGADRAELLRALAAANLDVVKYEDKAIDAARNQCSALNGRAQRLDWLASQRFTYKDVTTTEAQGKQINEALKGLGFCKV
jgi:ribosomal protein S11